MAGVEEPQGDRASGYVEEAIMRNGDDDSLEHGDTRAKSTRDAGGRWLKGHCPNPRGRPRKKFLSDHDRGDLRLFGKVVIDVAANGRVERMDRRTALLFKMYESAMKGRVSMQRFLYNEFALNDERLAKLRNRYESLMIEWVIKNPNFDGLDGDNIPIEVQLEITSLESVLSHYYPGQYPEPPPLKNRR
jgi:uncharacterized protein DUF5681